MSSASWSENCRPRETRCASRSCLIPKLKRKILARPQIPLVESRWRDSCRPRTHYNAHAHANHVLRPERSHGRRKHDHSQHTVSHDRSTPREVSSRDALAQRTSFARASRAQHGMHTTYVQSCRRKSGGREEAFTACTRRVPGVQSTEYGVRSAKPKVVCRRRVKSGRMLWVGWGRAPPRGATVAAAIVHVCGLWSRSVSFGYWYYDLVYTVCILTTL